MIATIIMISIDSIKPVMAILKTRRITFNVVMAAYPKHEDCA